MVAKAGKIQGDGDAEGSPPPVGEKVSVAARSAAGIEKNPDTVGAIGGEVALEGHAVGADRPGGDHMGVAGFGGENQAEPARPVVERTIQRPRLRPPAKEVSEGTRGRDGMGQAAVVPQRGAVQRRQGHAFLHAQAGEQSSALLLPGEIFQKLEPLPPHGAGVPFTLAKEDLCSSLQQADGGGQARRAAPSDSETTLVSRRPGRFPMRLGQCDHPGSIPHLGPMIPPSGLVL